MSQDFALNHLRSQIRPQLGIPCCNRLRLWDFHHHIGAMQSIESLCHIILWAHPRWDQSFTAARRPGCCTVHICPWAKRFYLNILCNHFLSSQSMPHKRSGISHTIVPSLLSHLWWEILLLGMICQIEDIGSGSANSPRHSLGMKLHSLQSRLHSLEHRCHTMSLLQSRFFSTSLYSRHLCIHRDKCLHRSQTRDLGICCLCSWCNHLRMYRPDKLRDILSIWQP